MASQSSSQNSSTPAPSLIPLGDFAGKPPLKLSKAVVLVGSDEQCHYRLTSSTISRLHALIIHEDNGVYIRDLASRTKIFVNGKEAKEAELKDGDEVRIGRFQFKFAWPDKSPVRAVRAGSAQIIIDGGGPPIPVLGRTLLIGRDPGCDVALTDQSVSTRHAIIFEVNGKRILRDFHSRSGTFLNGKNIHQEYIRRGNELRAGEVTLKLARRDESARDESARDESAEAVEAASLAVPAEEIAPIVAESKPPVAAKLVIPVEPQPQAEPVEEPTPVPVPEIDLSAEPLPLELEPELESPAEPVAPAEPTIDLSAEDVLAEPSPEPANEIPVHEQPASPAEPVIDLSAEPIPLETSPAAEAPAEIDLSFEGLLDEVAPLELEPTPEPAAGEAEASEPEPVLAIEPEIAPPIPVIDSPSEAAPIEVEPEPVASTPEPEPAPAVEATESKVMAIEIVAGPVVAIPHPETAPEIEPIESEIAPMISDIDFQPETSPIEISIDPEPTIHSIEPEIAHDVPATDFQSKSAPVETTAEPMAAVPHLEATPAFEEIEPEIAPAIPAIDFASEATPHEITAEPAEATSEAEPGPAIEAIEPEISTAIPDPDFSFDSMPIEIPPELPDAVEASAPQPNSAAGDVEPIDAPVIPEMDATLASAEPPEIAPETTVVLPIDEIGFTADAAAVEPAAPAPLDEIDLSFDSAFLDSEPQLTHTADPEPVEAIPIEPLAVDAVPADIAPPPLESVPPEFPEVDFSFDSTETGDPAAQPALEPIASPPQPAIPAIDRIQEAAPASASPAMEMESFDISSSPLPEIDFSAEFALLDRELEERHRPMEQPANEASPPPVAEAPSIPESAPESGDLNLDLNPLELAVEAPEPQVPVIEPVAGAAAIAETVVDAVVDAAPVEIPVIEPKRRGRPPKQPKAPKPPRTKAKRLGPKDRLEESSSPPAVPEFVDETLPALTPPVEAAGNITAVPEIVFEEPAPSIVEFSEPIETVEQAPFPLPVLDLPVPEPEFVDEPLPALMPHAEAVESIADTPLTAPVFEEPAPSAVEVPEPVETVAEAPPSEPIAEVPVPELEATVPEIPPSATDETISVFSVEHEFDSVLPEISNELSEPLAGPEPEIYETLASPPQPSVIGDLSIPTLGFTASAADVLLPELDEIGSPTIDITPPAASEPATAAVSETAPPAPVAPTPPPPQRHPPMNFLDSTGFFGGGTVNLDHFLGGMPVQLPEVPRTTEFHGGMPITLPPLPPNPEGFGKIHYDLEGTSASLFSTRPVPPPVPPKAVPPPEPPSESPFVPITLESLEPEAPVTEKAPPPPPKITPIPRSAVLKSAPRAGQKSAPFTNSPNEISLEDHQARNTGNINPADGVEPPTAFDGLAMPVRQTDVFSNFEAAAPVNDAAFGGVSLNQSDDYIVPESPAAAERRAEDAEQDFADDDFWNRTDEEDDLRQAVPVDPLNPAPTPSMPIEPQIAADSSELDVVAPDADAVAEQADLAESQADASIQTDHADPESFEADAEPPAPKIPPVFSRRAVSPETPAIEEPTEAIAPAEPAAVSRRVGRTSYTAPEQPVRKKRRFRIPFLMPLIFLIGILAALAAIWGFVPIQSQIAGKITFDNFIWTPGTQDSNEFEAAERRLLDDPRTRQHALDVLQRDHAGVSPGFLEVPELLGRAVSSFSLNSVAQNTGPQTTLQLSYSGTDPSGDRIRMQSLLQSLVDANAPLLDNNLRIRDAAQNSQQAVNDVQKQLDQIKAQLADAQQAIDNQPSSDEMSQFTSHNAELQKSQQVAEEAVNIDRSNLARLQAAGEASAAPSTQPAVIDPQLSQMRQQLADLSADIDSARSDQVAGGVMARQQLETAAKEFSDRLENANTILESGSQLRQFVDSAMDSQAKARDLIDMLIVDGEDLEKQLEDTRRDVEELIQSRQQEKWDADPQLLDLRDKLNSAQHRYNANVGEGVTDPRILDPLQREIDDCTAQVKARQDQLGVDPGEIKVQDALNGLIDSLRNKLDREKRQIDEVLDPLEKQLADLDPVVAALPAAQQDLAREIHERLDALNQARQKYSQTVGEGQVAPSIKVTDLQNKIADLKARIDARQADLTQQMVKSLDSQHAQDLKDAQGRLDSDQVALDAARKACTDALNSFEETQIRYNAAQAAQTKKLGLLDAQRTAYTQLESARRDRDDKQAAAERAFEIRPLTDSDIAPVATSDPRMMYSLFVLGAGLVGLTFFAFFSHSVNRDYSVKPSRKSALTGQIDSMVIPMANPADDHASHQNDELSDDDEHPLPI